MTYRPFDTVPTELLSQILTFAWLWDRSDNSFGRFRFPSITNQVDRFFNRTTIATPILWSYLRVTTMSNLPHIQDRILYKSGVLPLDIYLVFDRVQYSDARIMVEKTILSSPSRCRTITISHNLDAIQDIPPFADFWDHLQPLADLHPPLSTLRFSILNDDPETPLNFLPSFGPSLHSLLLSNCTFSWSSDSFPRNLMVLSVQDEEQVVHIDTATIHRCLSGPIRHSLRSVSLNGFYIDLPEGQQLDPFVLEGLEHFELKGFYFVEIATVFSIMFMPNLRHLALERIYKHNLPMRLAAVWKALRFPKLHKFTYQALEIRPHERVEFFQNHQNSVRCLEITGYTPHDPLLDPPTIGFCSQLHEIIAHEVPLHTLVSLVQGRCSSLQKLEARFKRGFLRQDLTRHQLETDFSFLKGSVMKFRILEEEEEDSDESNGLTFEEFIAFYPHV